MPAAEMEGQEKGRGAEKEEEQERRGKGRFAWATGLSLTAGEELLGAILCGCLLASAAPRPPELSTLLETAGMLPKLKLGMFRGSVCFLRACTPIQFLGQESCHQGDKPWTKFRYALWIIQCS